MELSRKYQILIVDDHKDFVKALDYQITDILSDKVQRIDYAYNGQEALAKIAAHPTYDIVFMDIMMPGMDGLTAIDRIRSYEAQHKRLVPKPAQVVVVTATGAVTPCGPHTQCIVDLTFRPSGE